MKKAEEELKEYWPILVVLVVMVIIVVNAFAPVPVSTRQLTAADSAKAAYVGQAQEGDLVVKSGKVFIVTERNESSRFLRIMRNRDEIVVPLTVEGLGLLDGGLITPKKDGPFYWMATLAIHDR